MRHVTRAAVVAVISASLAVGVAVCGIIEFPEGIDRPVITVPSTLPTRDSGEDPGSEDGGEPSPEETASPEEPAPEPTPEPETDEPAPEPETEEPAPPADDVETDATPVWVWWLLAAAVLAIAAIVVIVTRRGRAARQWEDKLTSVRSDLRWLEQALVPEVLSKSSTADAGAAWQAAKPRALRMDEELFALQTADVDDEKKARAAADLMALRALVNAVDAETAMSDHVHPDELRSRRADVEQARSTVRARWSTESQ